MKKFTIKLVEDLSELEMAELLKVWEKSVRASHFFLEEKDIKDLIPFVKMGIKESQNLFLAEDPSGQKVGLMGVDNDSLEMLFVSPELFGQGIGKLLVNHALNNMGVKFVDVNEQNDRACGFYRHLGFIEYARSEYDDQGNNFPLLHMQYGGKNKTK